MGGWYPGATRMPGRNAGYRVGRVSRQSAVAHYTVGVNSAGIGVQGYFQFLIRRNGEIVQFAESDAVCWHAGNWNPRGCGIEIEYLESKDGSHPANIFTAPQLAACARLVQWLVATDGYTRNFHDGVRLAAFLGFITHRSLIQTGDAHHDYWSRDQWNQMVGAQAPEPKPDPNPAQAPGDEGMASIIYEGKPKDYYIDGSSGLFSENWGPAEGPRRLNQDIFPRSWKFARGDKARVSVCDHDPVHKAYGYTVFALREDEKHVNAAVYHGAGKWSYHGAPA